MRADGGQLNLAFAFEGRGRKRGMQQNVGDQVQARGEIAAQDLGIDAEAVVAPVAIETAAYGLDFLRDLLRGTLRCAFEQQVAGELGQAAFFRRLRQHATLEDGAHFDERQAMVFLEEQAQAVGQLKLLNRVIARGFAGADGLGRGAGGQQGVEGAIFRSKIFARDPLEVGECDPLDGGEVAFGEVEVVGRQPASAQVLRLALHGLARREDGGDELLHGFPELGGGDRAVLHSFDLGQHRLPRRRKLVGIHYRAQAKQA